MVEADKDCVVTERDSFSRPRTYAKIPQIKETKKVMVHGQMVEVKVYSAGRMPVDPSKKAAEKEERKKHILALFAKFDKEK